MARALLQAGPFGGIDAHAYGPAPDLFRIALGATALPWCMVMLFTRHCILICRTAALSFKPRRASRLSEAKTWLASSPPAFSWPAHYFLSHCPGPKERDSGTDPPTPSLHGLDLLFEAMQRGLADAHFLGAIPEAKAFRQQGLQRFGLNVHQLLEIP